ncbi:plexin-A2 [Diachasma alloeum]|uniref:plexin-A2 n=1 Tax=Diachasma alloeum TaxID=454923 RepID=UPI0007384CE0|nr:plexin-A2 [Diachasma alloeum]
MQQDTLNSSNRFRCVVVVFMCLFIAKISTEDTSEINSTTTGDQITLTNEGSAAAITEDEIISSTPEIAISTISRDEITSKSTSETTVLPITKAEIISSTLVATVGTISATKEVEKKFTKEEIIPSASENEGKIVKEEVSLITSEIENISTTEKTSISTTEVEILNASKIVKSEDLRMDNCASLSDCMKCVKSSDLCNWSMDQNVCKSPDAAPGNLSGGSGVIENENYPGEVHRKGASFCPRIVTSRNITLPSDTHKMIKIKVSMKHVFSESRFTCRFGDGPEAITTTATLLMDTISCSNAHFSYPTDEPFVQLPIWVLNGGRELSNPKDIKLIIYKCRYMANNCISCFSFGRNYECGWCPGSSTCEIAGQCEETTIENLWIGRKGHCPQFTQ